jgi:hypothetical protein
MGEGGLEVGKVCTIKDVGSRVGTRRGIEIRQKRGGRRAEKAVVGV